MGMATIFKKTLYLMELLARENSAVQETLFEHIDDLLEVQIVPSNLAIALKEVNNKIWFYFDNQKSVLLFWDLYCTSNFFLIVLLRKSNDMLKSVLKTDSKDSFVVCPSSERGSRVFGVAKCFSESGRTRYDNQKEPSFSYEVYNAKLQEGRLCSGSTKRSKVSVNIGIIV